MPTPKCLFLDAEKLDAIHNASLEVFANTGVAIDHPAAQELLYSFGAKVGKNNLVKIPAGLVEKALSTAPSMIDVFDRDGTPAMQVGGNNLYYGSNAEDLEILDPLSQEVRSFLKKDRLLMTTLIDALPNYDFLFCGGAAKDENPAISDRMSFSGTAAFTKKPLIFTAEENLETCQEIIQAAAIIAGSAETLAQKPFIMNLSDPLSPLQNTRQGLNNIICCAKHNIPVIYLSYILLGMTGPMTFMGSLVQTNVECLSGLIISQLTKPGAPFIYSAMPAPFDMRTSIGTMGSPELHLLSAAASEIAAFYQLPFCGTAGTTDAYSIDEQAIMEATMSIMTTNFSRANLAHDVGLSYHCKIIAPYLLVFANEIINMVKTFNHGLDLSPEDLALDLIAKVGPGGAYISEEHTLKHFKKVWYPELLDRSIEPGGAGLKAKINAKMFTILENHTLPKLEPAIYQEILALEQCWQKSAK